ncbi:MAG TPA: hypothetical protein VGY13_10215 [Solirubrobacteraceae bacterium]|jgi:hypothetical protein|nr:hypothetical protein [Solirubrobacteraceae bacterium]
MADGDDLPELSQAELRAFDLLIAQLEESGQTSISGPEVFFTPTLVRVIVPVARIVTPAIIQGAEHAEPVSEAQAMRLLADKGELTLEELVEARKRLGG